MARERTNNGGRERNVRFVAMKKEREMCIYLICSSLSMYGFSVQWAFLLLLSSSSSPHFLRIQTSSSWEKASKWATMMTTWKIMGPVHFGP
jgi:hypothetical protein